MIIPYCEKLISNRRDVARERKWTLSNGILMGKLRIALTITLGGGEKCAQCKIIYPHRVFLTVEIIDCDTFVVKAR